MAKTTNDVTSPKTLDAAAPAPVPAAPSPAAAATPTAAAPVNHHWTLIVGSILVVLIIGAIVFMVLNDDPADSNANIADTASESSPAATATPAAIKNSTQLDAAASDLDATNLDSIDADLNKNDSDATNF